ncbi:superoxide dismutase family protein [Sphingomonas nostoxanthinifaciens]|uniref:superoxide dismutase family protein n=1 Tax=Sphingomonas nostoxanthinifaciens TaxID=2872652 RepID=UPI001CC1FBA6|nr:superoxide dismutase family protein [Sphingomonas nostoxanthinifaciens]UAK23430.1 superoxide dismutase family protein [Sphingomonas nostoxanthinifaciens]
MIRSLSLTIAATALAASPIAAQTPVTATFKGVQGTATLTPAPKGILIRIEASGLTPGWHGIHIHEKGDCSDAAFKAAGAHVHMATPAVHGLLNPQASDQGDLPNLYVGADGTVKADLFTSLVMLPALQDADGAAIVIHAKPDDYTTQPIGGAGDRVACAVVR